MKIDFAIFVCLYPVCTAAMQYLIAARYKLLDWDYFQKKTDSQFMSLVDFAIWVIVSFALYFK